MRSRPTPAQSFHDFGHHRTTDDGQRDLAGGNMFHGSGGYTESNPHHRRALDATLGGAEYDSMVGTDLTGDWFTLWNPIGRDLVTIGFPVETSSPRLRYLTVCSLRW